MRQLVDRIWRGKWGWVRRGYASREVSDGQLTLKGSQNSIDALVTVGDIKKEVFLVVLLIKRAQGRARGRDHVINEEKEGIFGTQVDPLPNEEVELPNGQVGWNQILLFVQIADASFRSLLHDNWHSIWILFPDFLAFGPSFLEWMFFFILPLHFWKFKSRNFNLAR